MTNDLKAKSQEFLNDLKNLQQSDVFIWDRTPLLFHIAELQKVIDDYEARVEKLKDLSKIKIVQKPYALAISRAIEIMEEGE